MWFSMLALIAAPLTPGSPFDISNTSPSFPGWSPPGIEVWTSPDRVLTAGERVRVYFRTRHTDAYVTVFRVDTDGRIEVLFPADPWDHNYARAGRRYEVPGRLDRHSFVANDYPGQGFLFAVASPDPFDYSAWVTAGRWDHRYIADGGTVAGDPYVVLTDLIDVMIPMHHVEYDYDVLPYDVGRHYDYPRFLCYDCHAATPYPAWDPYRDQCVRFRIVVYDSPHYYPARTAPPTRVVFSKPRRLEPRYVFVGRQPAEPYLETVPARPMNDPGPRRLTPDVEEVGDRPIRPTPRRADENGRERRPERAVVPRQPTPSAREIPNRARPDTVSTTDRRRLTPPPDTTRADPKREAERRPSLQRREPPPAVEKKPERPAPRRRVKPDTTQTGSGPETPG